MSTATERIEPISEEFVRSDKDYLYEIVDGQSLEKPRMGAEADLVIVELIAIIKGHAAGRLGRCFSGHCGYQIFADDPGRVRYPDVSFIRSGRLPGNKAPKGHVQVVPDLVVEVVSPNDKAENVDERLTDFLRAGVPLAWMIYPSSKQVYVFHQGPAALRLGLGDILDGEDVLPGFACPLNDLFAAI
jgi:Uma2 family endonuclease